MTTLREAAQAALEALRKSMQGNLMFDEAIEAFNGLSAALERESTARHVDRGVGAAAQAFIDQWDKDRGLVYDKIDDLRSALAQPGGISDVPGGDEPPPPSALVGAMQDTVHKTSGRVRDARTAAAPPARPVPLTKADIDFVLSDSFLAANGSVYSTRIYDFVRAIERAHGIE